MWYWQKTKKTNKKGHEDQWNRLEDPDKIHAATAT
jgi:hypothetical protein